MIKKPVVLITNRFDQRCKLKLSSLQQGQFQFVQNIYEDENLLAQADGLIIRSSTKVDLNLLSKAKKLNFIITATSGFDHIDLDLTKAKRIHCFHIPETQSVAAAELTIFLMLATCRKYTLAKSQLEKGDWQRSLLLGKQLLGQSLGLVGLGRVGKEVAKRAKALGLKVSAFDPYIQEHDPEVQMLGFEELIRSSDIVSLHVPKTKRTRHMIRKESLSWMSPEGILINMSRGDVVHEVDLIDHLQANPNFRAGLDVFNREPLSVDSRLLELQNVCLTPHIGASTEEALYQSSQKSLDMALIILEGGRPETSLPPLELWFDE